MDKIAIDLFCGSGAVTWGLKQAGFRVVAALDVDKTVCTTYRMNHPEVKLYETDITVTDTMDIERGCSKHIDVLAICAPCQPFSSQNRKRVFPDDRASLILHTLPFIESLSPTLVFVENVPRFGKEQTLRSFCSNLEALGYSIGPLTVVDAASFGVPQRRQRAMLIAADESRSCLRKAYEFVALPNRTVADAIRDLPKPCIGQIHEMPDPLHYARRHQARTLERLRHVPKDGGSRKSLPQRLQLKCHMNIKSGSFSDTYGRMKWDEVAPTLTTGCTDVTRGRYAHPEQHRAITLREAARLQSFPDEYQFFGNSSQIASQIGNAVPPLMMQAIAKAMVNAVECN